MEPRIQYAKTSDGVRIACCATGEGVPLVLLQGLPGHLQLDWEIFREAYESFSQRGYRLIRLDFAGSGLSDHAGVSSFEMLSFEKYALNIEAVAAYFGLESFALFAQGPASPIAIAFAASRPERVSHLVLWEGFAAFEQIATESQIQALFALLDTDYVLYTKTIFSAVLGWAAGDVARRYAAMLREGQTAEEARTSARAWRSLDARPFLSEVRAPTLIAHRFGFALVPVDVLRELSAEIPNATLVLLEGETADVRPLYSAQMRRVLDEFLLGAAAQPINVDPLSAAATEGSGTLPSGTAVILFADIADSTALTERLGDAAFRGKARDLDAALRSIIREHGGTPSKASFSETASSPSSPAPATPSRPPSPALKRAPKRPSPSTSASTQETSSARRTTSTAAPSTSPRASAACPRRVTCWCRTRCARWRARRPGCGSRIAASRRSRASASPCACGRCEWGGRDRASGDAPALFRPLSLD